MSSPFQNIDQSLAAAESSVEIIATALAADDSYTEEGKNERFIRHTQDHRTHLDQLNATIDKIIPAAEAHLNTIRAEVLPTPADDTAAVAAEMQAARILARKGMDDAQYAIRWVQETPPSPARTAVMEELLERGTLRREQIEGLIEATHPAYTDAKKQFLDAQTLVNGVYRPRLDAVAACLNNRKAPMQRQALRHTSELFDNLPPVSIGRVPTWTPTNAENVYRNR